MEITRPGYVWFYADQEIDVYPSMEAFEAALRRYLKLGWKDEIVYDSNGNVLREGVALEHKVLMEIRTLEGGGV